MSVFSVIIPVFNTPPDWLCSAVNSIRNQSYQNLDILLIDDCSTERETSDACESLENNDHRVRVVRMTKNRGIGYALNVGLRLSKSEFVFRMDADDISLPNRIETQLAYLRESPEIDILGAGLNYLLETPNGWGIMQSPIIHPAEITFELAKNSFWFLNHPTVVFKKSKILEIGGYDESLRGLPEDYELWIRSLQNKLVIRNLQESLLLLRISAESLSKNFSENKKAFQENLQKKLP